MEMQFEHWQINALALKREKSVFAVVCKQPLEETVPPFTQAYLLPHLQHIMQSFCVSMCGISGLISIYRELACRHHPRE